MPSDEASIESAVPKRKSIDDFLSRLPAAVLFARLPVPLLAVNDEGVIVHCNAAMGVVTGRRTYELEGAGVGSLVSEIAIGGVDVLESIRRLEGSIVTIGRPDGFRAYARFSASLLSCDDDRFLIIAFEDVTEHLWSEDWLCSTPSDGSGASPAHSRDRR